MRNFGSILVGSVALLAASAHATLITFDDVSVNTLASIQGTYAGLNWNNFYILNETFRPGTGFVPGTISGLNSAFNGNNRVAEITAQSGSQFTFNSGYFTAAYAPAEGVEIDGYRNGVQIYTSSFSIMPTSPTFMRFNWVGLDSVKFVSKGNSFIVMDNLTVNESVPYIGANQSIPAVPEPSTWASGLAMSLLMLGGLIRKKQR